jgi:hypothetical protein
MWMSTMEFVFGQVPIDNTRCAKIGLQASLREIASTEEELRAELEAEEAELQQLEELLLLLQAGPAETAALLAFQEAP